VPQNRWRLFFVGLRSDLGHKAIPRPPIQSHVTQNPLEGTAFPEDKWMVAGADVPIVDNPLRAVSVREAIGDLPRQRAHLEGRQPVEQRLSLRGTSSTYVDQLRAWPGVVAPLEVSGNWYRYTPRDFETFRLMAHDDRYPEAVKIAHGLFQQHLMGLEEPPRPGTEQWEELKSRFVPPYRNDAFHDKWRKLKPDEPSWTVTAHLSKDTYSHIHYDSRQARTITIREAARLQSFPDGVEFAGNFGEQYRQIGNAVPPVMARALGMSLLEQLRELREGASKRAAG
jgi:DNA (cytosine-5)-methyltransferase 1